MKIKQYVGLAIKVNRLNILIIQLVSQSRATVGKLLVCKG